MVYTNKMESDMTDEFTHPKDAKEGHKWQDSGGAPVDALHYFPEANGDTIAAVINGNMDAFNDDGFYYIAGADYYRLIDAPVEREVWVNLDEDGTVRVYDSKKGADVDAYPDRIACKRVNFAEGEFDDE